MFGVITLAANTASHRDLLARRSLSLRVKRRLVRLDNVLEGLVGSKNTFKRNTGACS